MSPLNKTNVELKKRLPGLNETNVEVEKRMSPLNKRSIEIQKQRSYVKMTNKLSFDTKNASWYMSSEISASLIAPSGLIVLSKFCGIMESKIFRHPKVGLRKFVYFKPTHDIIIQIGWFSTQQFNDLCNFAISRGLQIQQM